MQNYNSLLTLSHLAELSDGVVLVQNDVLNATCTSLLNIQRPNLKARDNMIT